MNRVWIPLIALAACADPSGSPAPIDPVQRSGELVAETAVTRVAASADLPVTFTNGSAVEVSVGPLSCVTEYDRLTPDGWQHVASLRMCIEIIQLVAAGEKVAYVTPAPENPGSYRVSFRAYINGESRTVTSGTFEVF